MATITRLSPITGRLTTYVEHYTLATYAPFSPPGLESYKTLINNELTTKGYDAFVDDAKFYVQPFEVSVQTHLWIAGSSPVDPFIGLAILAIIILIGISYLAWTITSSAQAIVEKFWPTPSYYQTDVNGNPVTVHSQAEYITCMRAANPGKFICGYCGQPFDTEEEKNTHEQNCPWKSGVPGQPPAWAGILILGLGAVVVVVGIWAVAKIFGKEKGPPIIVTR